MAIWYILSVLGTAHAATPLIDYADDTVAAQAPRCSTETFDRTSFFGRVTPLEASQADEAVYTAAWTDAEATCGLRNVVVLDEHWADVSRWTTQRDRCAPVGTTAASVMLELYSVQYVLAYQCAGDAPIADFVPVGDPTWPIHSRRPIVLPGEEMSDLETRGVSRFASQSSVDAPYSTMARDMAPEDLLVD